MICCFSRLATIFRHQKYFDYLDAYERGHGAVFSVPGESGDERNPAQAPRPGTSFLPVFQDLFLDPKP